jgi:NADPH:quinone reductase-like Zn-dependent oxidoreductase
MYPAPPGASDILGIEFSGTIDMLGDAVFGWKVGDAVFGLAGGVSPSRTLRSGVPHLQ